MTPRGSRSYASIVLANSFTIFNAILLAFGCLTLAFGDPRDALFLGIVVANTTVGITQEVRAKRALDRLSALVAPHARLAEEGGERVVGVEELRPGDEVLLQTGDQVVADGRLLETSSLRIDESILTGESTPVRRAAGEEVRSGAFVAEGSGRMRVVAVGPDSYAERLAGEARAFRHPRSPLELALNRLLLALVAAMVPLTAILGASLLLRHTSMGRAVPKATAAMTSLVPEGLILLTSLTFAVAAARMARHGALAQQLNAIESLASVDVICVDKTGTLTDSTLTAVGAGGADGVAPSELEDALGRYAAATTSRNLTIEAIAQRWPRTGRRALDEVPFASRWRWSAVRDERGWLVLGAPEAMLAGAPGLAARAAQEARLGRRVVALGRAAEAPPDGPPPAVEPLGIVMLAERLRPSTVDTVRYLHSQGVTIRVLSGDAPATVAAIARDAGIPGAETAVDGRELPADPRELRELLERAAVVGRISPEDKRRVVEALGEGGRYVAMIGDGVNDVLALKAARLAIAQGSGAQMAKSVADVVLVSGDFATVPRMIGEGRRILRNVRRVARLFVAKSVFAAVLILTVGTTARAYPLLPRHLSIASTFGVGVPGFFLALAPSSGRWRSSGFLSDILRFAVPAGVAIGAVVVASYLTALDLLDLTLTSARTVSTTVLLGGLLFLIVVLEGSLAGRRGPVVTLVALMATGYAIVLALAPARRFFALATPTPASVAVAGAGLVLTGVLVSGGLRLAGAQPHSS